MVSYHAGLFWGFLFILAAELEAKACLCIVSPHSAPRLSSNLLVMPKVFWCVLILTFLTRLLDFLSSMSFKYKMFCNYFHSEYAVCWGITQGLAHVFFPPRCQYVVKENTHTSTHAYTHTSTHAHTL